MRNGLRFFLLGTCLLLVPARALATQPMLPPDQSFLLEPAEPSPLVLREAQLTFTVGEPVSRAQVEAVYQVENPTGQMVQADMVWTYVDVYAKNPHPPAVTVDGAPVEPQVQTDADRFRPLLETWLQKHPAVKAAFLKREQAVEQAFRERDGHGNFRDHSPPQVEADWSHLTKLLADAGTGSASRGDALAMSHLLEETATREEIVLLCRRLVPEEADNLQQSWGAPARAWPSGIYWARFPITVPAGGVVAIRTTHDQMASSWTYQVVLAHATTWTKVGPMSAVVRTPHGFGVQASVPVGHHNDHDALDLSLRPYALEINVVRSPFAPTTRGPWQWLGPLLLGGAVVVGVTVVARRRRIRR